MVYIAAVTVSLSIVMGYVISAHDRVLASMQADWLYTSGCMYIAVAHFAAQLRF
jgi:hypothetical protein